MLEAYENTPSAMGCASQDSSAIPSAFDAIQAIGRQANLTPHERDKLNSAVRTYVRLRTPRFQGRGVRTSDIMNEAHNVPMDCAAMNKCLFERSAAFHGMTNKSFDSFVSLLREVLRLLNRYGVPLPKAPHLAEEWKELYAELGDERQKAMIAFFGYCTVYDIKPRDDIQAALEAFVLWSNAWTLHRDPRNRAKRCASNWNWGCEHVSGWPDARIAMPDMRDEYTLPLDRYLPSLQADIRSYLDRLACRDRRSIFPDKVATPGYKSPRSRPRPLRPATIRTREYQIRQALTALVRTGIPISSLSTCLDLVHPVERVKTILDFHIERRLTKLRREREELEGAVPGDSGDEWDDHDDPEVHRSTNLAGIGEVLRQIAKHHCGLPDEDVTLIAIWVGAVKPPPQTSMTDKNATRLRDLLEPSTYAQLLHHPEKLMLWADPAARKSMKLAEMKPRARALFALYAVAIEILLICPMRRTNLANLRIDRSLRRGSDGSITHLLVPGKEVKTGKPIDWPVPKESAELIEKFLREHRPHLAEAGNPYLFPGAGKRARGPHDLAVGFKERIEGDLGVEINMHIMRHMAVVRFLTFHPGQYTVVQRILGHRSVKTTIAFYSGPEMEAAIELFLSVLRQGRLDPLLGADIDSRSGRRKLARG